METMIMTLRLSPEEAAAFDEFMRKRCLADKRGEFERLMDEDYEAAHCLLNASGDYSEWMSIHDCEKYPDHTGIKCAVCGGELKGEESA